MTAEPSDSVDLKRNPSDAAADLKRNSMFFSNGAGVLENEFSSMFEGDGDLAAVAQLATTFWHKKDPQALLEDEQTMMSLSRGGEEEATVAAKLRDTLLPMLPRLDWHRENGIFAIDGEEFRTIARGTTMEDWHYKSIDDTDKVLRKLHSVEVNGIPRYRFTINIDHVRWAYMLWMAHAVEVEVTPDILKGLGKMPDEETAGAPSPSSQAKASQAQASQPQASQ